jgi:uncharacterized repeat protein (TIGR03803 family)
MTLSGRYHFLATVFRSMLVVLTGMLVLGTIGAPAACAQTYTVIHSFTGAADGGDPLGGLTMDAAGNLYGTTFGAFQRCGYQCGTVFKMKNTGHGWILTPLYKFTGGSDGANPYAGVVFGPDGALYGTTEFGGVSCRSDDFNESGCGNVFRLAPPPTTCNSTSCPWVETVLYSFTGGYNDGAFPVDRVAFEQAGNIHGTTLSGGDFGSGNCAYAAGWCGTLFTLTHSNGGWTETVPHVFTGGGDGANPIAGLTADTAGNFYGVATDGGNGNGTIFELTPSGENTVYTLAGNATLPQGDLIFDPAGNFYGTAGGYNGGAAVFEMMPSGGGWNFALLYNLGGSLEGDGPLSGVVRDSAGNLYGTAHALGSNGVGLVFKLTPSNGSWIYTVLHEFATGEGGDYPIGGLVLDAQGNLYGTASGGGAYGWGVVWEITP